MLNAAQEKALAAKLELERQERLAAKVGKETQIKPPVKAKR